MCNMNSGEQLLSSKKKKKLVFFLNLVNKINILSRKCYMCYIYLVFKDTFKITIRIETWWTNVNYPREIAAG